MGLAVGGGTEVPSVGDVCLRPWKGGRRGKDAQAHAPTVLRMECHGKHPHSPASSAHVCLGHVASSCCGSLERCMRCPCSGAPHSTACFLQALHAAPGTNRVVLKRRKGFIKLALLTGAALVPAYVFGETSLFRTSTSSGARRWQRALTRTLGESTAMLGHPLILLALWLIGQAVGLERRWPTLPVPHCRHIHMLLALLLP